MSGESHTLSFHEGEALYTLAKTYPTLRLCLVEAVQNAIDANASCVYVGVDLMKRRVAVCDNGSGVTPEKFQQALRSIGKGIKSKDALGRFGRGLIASIHLGKTMSFLSRPRGGRHVNSWVFVGASLRRQHSDLTIPYSKLETFPELPEPFERSRNEAGISSKRVEWRTMLLLDDVTGDQTITHIDAEDVEHLIRTKLGHAMHQHKTTVFLKVRDESGLITKRRIDPAAYTGEKLEVVDYLASHAGNVTFNLYRARLQAGKRQGQVVVKQSGDNYPITIQELRTQALGARYYSKDLGLAEIKLGIDALCSGYFEGVISVDNIELAPERTKFELNDPLTDAFVLIGDWYDKVGGPLINDAREEQAEKRYQELGSQSLDRLIQQLQDNEAFARLAHDLRGMLPAARTSRPDRESREGSPRTSRPQDKRRVIAKPKQQPEGSPRSPVSSFLTFAYELLSGSSRLWEYDPESGVLTFNIRHPLWTKVDDPTGKRSLKNDKRVMALQEWLAFKLLLLLAERIDSSDIELHRAPIDKEVELYVEMFILGG